MKSPWMMFALLSLTHMAKSQLPNHMTKSVITREVSLPGSRCNPTPTHQNVIAAHVFGQDSVDGGCVKLDLTEDNFIIVYESLTLVCGQKLKVLYSSARANIVFNVIDCNTQQDHPAALAPGSQVTVMFENPGHASNYNFSLLITSYKRDAECVGTPQKPKYLCFSNNKNICVDGGVQCDGHVNCPDGQDEDDGCAEDKPESDVARRYHRVTTGIVAVILIGAIVTCVGCITAIVCCIRQYQTRDREVFPQTTDSQDFQQHSETVPGSTGFYPTGPQSSHTGGYQRLEQEGYDQPTHGGYDPSPQGSFEPLPASIHASNAGGESGGPGMESPDVDDQGDTRGSSPTAADDSHLFIDSQAVGYNATSSDVQVPLQEVIDYN